MTRIVNEINEYYKSLISSVSEMTGVTKNGALWIFNSIKSIKRHFESYILKKERIYELKQLMQKSNSFEEWKHYATELDELEGKFKWKSKKETGLYNWQAVEKLIILLSQKREIKDIKGLMHIIRSNLITNIYNTNDPILYEIS